VLRSKALVGNLDARPLEGAERMKVSMGAGWNIAKLCADTGNKSLE